MRRAVLAIVVLLSLNVLHCVQVSISAKHLQATQPQKAGPPAESAESAAFNVGKFPIGIIFDGTNIWVTNGRSESVSELKR